jgi:hypothetical protein
VKELRDTNLGRSGFRFRKGRSDWMVLALADTEPRVLRAFVKEAHAAASR